MVAVIFEVVPTKEGKEEYLRIAAGLKDRLRDIPGFISIERFQSLVDPEKLLSLSFWKDEESVTAWRNMEKHRRAQERGRSRLFREYRIMVATTIRDYTMEDRGEAPEDSRR